MLVKDLIPYLISGKFNPCNHEPVGDGEDLSPFTTNTKCSTCGEYLIAVPTEIGTYYITYPDFNIMNSENRG